MYKLPKLPYLFQDLEPYIDIHTMGLHYHKHHQNYIDKLNTILMNNDYDYRYSLDELIYNLNEFEEGSREEILFNLGGVLNHNLYWKSINPNQPKKPTGKLKLYLEKTFGSLDNFFKTFKEKALKLKGSGYTFLVLKRNGKLDIINLPNQETPLSYGYIPLFTVDLWEHAYYLKYQNNKKDYIENFFNIIDYQKVSENLDKII